MLVCHGIIIRSDISSLHVQGQFDVVTMYIYMSDRWVYYRYHKQARKPYVSQFFDLEQPFRLNKKLAVRARAVKIFGI